MIKCKVSLYWRKEGMTYSSRVNVVFPLVKGYKMESNVYGVM